MTAVRAPLRLMSIMPSAPPGRRFTSDITIKALEGIAAIEPMEYRSLAAKDATMRNIRDQLETFRPQVVHFEGYVSVATPDTDDDSPYVQLLTTDQSVKTDVFAELLIKHGVQLLVIGRNSVGQVYQNAGAQATLKLIQHGLPAVIAPMRAIDDASATTFTTEFYRAFLQGNTLESALHLARRRLASKGGDWSVFALFADPARLDYFQLLRESA